jgi:hypothetical protein
VLGRPLERNRQWRAKLEGHPDGWEVLPHPEHDLRHFSGSREPEDADTQIGGGRQASYGTGFSGQAERVGGETLRQPSNRPEQQWIIVLLTQ